MSDEPEILNLLRGIQAEQIEHGRKLDILQQDTGLIRSVLSGHTRTLDILLQDGRLLRGAVNDVVKESVTPGEVEAIHHDLNRLQQQVSELTARLDNMEGRGH